LGLPFPASCAAGARPSCQPPTRAPSPPVNANPLTMDDLYAMPNRLCTFCGAPARLPLQFNLGPPLPAVLLLPAHRSRLLPPGRLRPAALT
jgi:hypothetical protein